MKTDAGWYAVLATSVFVAGSSIGGAEASWFVT
jgi:hypothetical protein